MRTLLPQAHTAPAPQTLIIRLDGGGMIMFIRALVVTVCFIALLTPGAAAQSVGGGVKGGVTFGDVPNFLDEIGEPGASTSLRVGYAVGGFVAIRFDGGFSLQPEVLYTQKGVRIDVSEGGFTADLRYKADYVDIPVLARYTFGKGVRGYVFGGPSFDISMSAKMSVGVFGESDEEDISDEVESFEIALVFGGGIELGPILVEARWSEGLTNVAANDTGTSLKTRTILLLGGIRF
jgi:Outer membrane protein beta-barrel domain